jgi:ATP-dependent DNA helicase RecG
MRKEIELDTKRKNILVKQGLKTYDQLSRFIPKKYYDLREEVRPDASQYKKQIMSVGTMTNIQSKVSMSGTKMVEAFFTSDKYGTSLKIVWFHTDYPFTLYHEHIGEKFLVYGTLQEGYNGGIPQIISPVFFTNCYHQLYGRIIPCYKTPGSKRFQGFSEEALSDLIIRSADEDLTAPFEDVFLKAHNLLSPSELSKNLHEPESELEIKKAKMQLALEDLTYFSLKMLSMDEANCGGSVRIEKRDLTKKIIDGLPFTLTDGQKDALNQISVKLMRGTQVNALVQGDVSCGKSIVAFLLAALFCENGYQVAMLAPTVTLASQHYEEVKKTLEPYGIRCGFLHGALKAKEKKELLEELKKGNIDLLIGTHALVSDRVEFANLGLAIIDEEQRFGVICREKLREKAKNPISYISMSATPIPRSYAIGLYGESVDLFSIKSMPAGRKPVKTFITDQFEVPRLVAHEMENGRQVYVVCALIDDAGSEEESDIVSAEKTKAIYQKAFPDRRIELLSGKTKDDKMLEIMQDYKDKKVDILIATTVIEVGVNNPNSSVIIIQNAERFGLSTLHQLRGRVRRGSYQPYCVLMSKDVNNDRLLAMQKTDDGFELSRLDLEQRKSGNLIGTKQSGKNKFMETMFTYPKLYELSKAYARELHGSPAEQRFLSALDEFYEYDKAE